MTPVQTKQLVVINSGSSSIKFAAYEFSPELKRTLNGYVENITLSPVLKMFDANGVLVKQEEFDQQVSYEYFYEKLLSAFSSNQFNYTVYAVGHRVAHGGNTYQAPVLVTHKIIEDLKKYISFVPLHQPFNLKAIESIQKALPKMPQVACFDTAFHCTHPLVADRFGIPHALFEEGVKRYGFHGLSYEYVVHKLTEINPDKFPSRMVVAHLGNGASMCAIKDGKSIDSTMGFTALDGLVMGTRCGSLDPGVILYLMKYKNMTYQEIEHTLYKKSGLLGVSTISHDMKKLLKDSRQSSIDAIELFVYRIRRELGALVSVLGGLDVLVFTGGIGEHAWQIRENVCLHSEWLGLNLDFESNKKNAPIISTPTSKVEVRIVPTDEEWIIAHHTYQTIINNRP